MNQKGPPAGEAGVVHLAVPLLLLLTGAAAVFILVSAGVLKGPKLPALPSLKKEPTVSLQKQYVNPFDKASQYINPFSEYKNPFDALKK